MGASSGGDEGVATAETAAPRTDDTLPSSPGGASADRDDLPHLTPVDARHYAVGRELAKGGMGRIRAARDLRLGRDVAIKELLVRDKGLRERFEREARITARLAHPAIVAIHEAGVWPSGEPFFSMKLVAGRSLDRAIADAATPSARMGLLPHAIAAVDALAFAHNHRVIHRDLKPQNVLVGDFGETVVIDWGLAKDLADANAPDVAVGPYRETIAPGQTVLGAVIGTPAYMPPEQARGLSVDERADVYSLGALLYHVLAGAAPYSGRTADAVLATVIERAPAPLAARAPETPPDLIAIVEKAMARAPDDRYPSARELADDLKRFQTGQLVGAHRYSTRQLVARWLRRHRAAVTASAVAMIVIAVGGTFAVRAIVRERDAAQDAEHVAEARKAEADTRREAAEKLIDFSIFQLRDKLQPQGKIEYLAGLGEAVVGYYDKVGDPGADVMAARRRDAALTLLGDVRASKGDTKGALEEYRASLATKQRLLAADPKNALLRRDLSVSYERIGTVLTDTGDLDGALAAERSNVGLREALLAEHPDLAKAKDDLAEAYQHLGTVAAARGALDDADAAYGKELALRAALAAAAPDDGKAQSDLALAHEDKGDLLVERALRVKALDEYRIAQALREHVAARWPDNRFWKEVLAVSRERIGRTEFDMGDFPHALEDRHARRVIQEDIVAHDPDDASKLRDLAMSIADEGEVYYKLARDDQALPLYQRAIALMKALVARDPANEAWQRDLGVAYERLGNVDLDRGDAPAALVTFRTELALSDGLLAKTPHNPLRLRDDAIVHEWLGNVDRKLRAYDDAAAEYKQMIAQLGEAAAAQPSNDNAQMDLETAWEDLGDGQREAGRRADANASYREAQRMFDRIKARLDDAALVQVGTADLDAKIAITSDDAAERARLTAAARGVVDHFDRNARTDLAPMVADVDALLSGRAPSPPH